MSEIRDFAAEQRAAIEAKIKVVKADGGDSGHLEALLRGGGPGEHGAAVEVAQPMAPGTVEPGTPLSPLPSQQPEPADGSAPDKRDQDNSPVRKVQEGVEVVVGPKDPGPGAKESGPLPEQPAGVVVPDKKKPGELPDQTDGFSDPEEVDMEQLQRDARAKDKRRDKAEAENKISAENKGMKAALENKAQPKSEPAKKPPPRASK